MTANIRIIPVGEFEKVRKSTVHELDKLSLIADMCRANTLASIKLAGSGHLGSSFSSLDIVTLLYYSEMNVIELGIEHPDRDIYLSSKGHDVPGQYSVLHSLGIVPKEQFLRLRRLGGTHGHPDVSIPGIEANTGSLGMGISKGKGIAIAKRLLGRAGRVFVLTGDGELQEGQVFEALQSAAHQGLSGIHVIVDHNKVQSDKEVSHICDLESLEDKFRSFGWHVARCNGHDFRMLHDALRAFRCLDEKPKLLIADTVKGRGVSFMEHPEALAAGGGLYRWHAGAPDDLTYEAAYDEIVRRIRAGFENMQLPQLILEETDPPAKKGNGVSREYVAEAFGQALVEIAGRHPELVVLDADLAADCRVRAFEERFPERFIENGIAEQDMVSTAGGLALQGLLPVVNTFAAFLAARANEQIYNNACERSKVIYVCHYAGLIPAGPGASHQSVRDISLLGGLPGFTVIQPCNGIETRLALGYCVEEAQGSCVLRLNIGPSPHEIALPERYSLTYGQGVALTEGGDYILFAYGPVMLHEALLASDLLKQRGVGLKVINMPWLNCSDPEWLSRTVSPYGSIYVLEDHWPCGGIADHLLTQLCKSNLLSGRRFERFAVEGHPACGTPAEALCYHRLDGESLADRILY